MSKKQTLPSNCEIEGWKVEVIGDHLHVAVDGSPGYFMLRPGDAGLEVGIWADDGAEPAGFLEVGYPQLEPE